jgi:leader peptidase (prepilin peptidase)/N-methyltransferase
MSCSTTLTWKELIPILSFAIQRGSCKKCKTKISWQYPIVEFIAGIIFAALFVAFPPIEPLMAVTTLFYIVITCLYVVIAVYDAKHKIIPDSLSYTVAGVAFVSLWIGGSSWFHIPSVYALIAGPVLALPFALLWLVSRNTKKGEWIGLGDAKLTLSIGWLLGISKGINALVLAFWIAAPVAIVWLYFVQKRLKSRTEVPFGPYLLIGTYLVLIFGIQVIDVHMLVDILKSLIFGFGV